jgi:glycosyltransferase involved in cell wall biosynthesis
MKILMFGWEFPPHISGGLGTASYGLTKGLSKFDDINLIFVVPKLFGDEDTGVAKLVGAGDIKMDFEKHSINYSFSEHSLKNISKKINETELYNVEDFFKNFTKIEINSVLTPYLSPENFENYIKNIGLKFSDLKITKEGKIIYLENGEYKELVLDSTTENTYIDKGFYNFSGKYGPNLIDEVKNYAKIAAKIGLIYDFDIIHAHDWLTYLAGIEAKKISGKPLVIHVHATEFDRSGENINQIVYNIEKQGMDNADKIITVSNLTRKIVIEKYGQNPDKVVTVHNAVEPIYERRKIYKKTVDDKIITFLGRITFQKGPEYFIEAAKLVLDKTDGLRFVMAGSGDMLRRMIRHAASLRISDKFHFTDFLRGDEVTRMFDISDVYVMPSVSEPFGISPLEAMRSNVPVIISKQSGVAEVLHHAIKVDFWDTYAIADAIYGLAKYNGLSEMFRKYGKQEVDNMKWENSAKKIRQIYLDLLKKS